MQNFYVRFLCLKIFTPAVLQFSDVKILFDSDYETYLFIELSSKPGGW